MRVGRALYDLARETGARSIFVVGTGKNVGKTVAMRAMYEAAAHSDQPLAFVCAGTACSKPSTTTNQLRIALSDFQVNEIGRSLAIPSGSTEAATISP